jgi:hypothetical protein
MKLDHNVTAIDLCDGGKSYGHTQIMNILKRKREILDDFENNVPSSRKRQHLRKIPIFRNHFRCYFKNKFTVKQRF